jgi:hypothetical protein
MPSIRHTIPFLALTGTLVAACSDSGLPDDEAHLGTSESALCGISIDIKKSLIVHRADTANGSATILDAFPFKAVMDQLVASAAATNTSASLYQNAMRIAEPSTTPGTSGAFHCDTASVDPNNWGYECPRQGDADLGDVDPFAPADRFVPVALVNRIDLMPANRANCGEYRIVFAKKPGQGPGRFFFIFEGKLPNPGGAGSVEGCKAVGEVWQGLSTMTVAQRRDRLRRFYFEGVDVTLSTGTVKTTPVFTWSNYAGSMGQIRTNQFVNFPWTLRELKLEKSGTALRARPVTVKTNLANEPLVQAANPLHATAVATVQANLTASRLLAGSAAAITATTSNQVNSWESRDDSDIDYSLITPATVKAELTMPAGSTLTKNNALDRLTTQTCMGCHQHSNNRALGGGVTWPSSLGFVHIDEGGNVSPALTNAFLPARLAKFRSIVETGCPSVAAFEGADEGAVN